MTNRLFQQPTESAFSELNIKTLLTKESDGEAEMWVMQGLELDIVAQAPTIPEVKNRFIRTIATHIIVASETGTKPFANIKPAPRQYWDKYDSADALRETLSLSIPGDEIPPDFPTSRLPRGQALIKVA
jgi:hypothetical protein